MAAMKAMKREGFRRMMVIGQRWNTEVPTATTWASIDEMFESVTRYRMCGTLFQTNAEDYFFVTRNLWDWESLPPVILVGLLSLS